jgi:hypothetical protein
MKRERESAISKRRSKVGTGDWRSHLIVLAVGVRAGPPRGALWAFKLGQQRTSLLVVPVEAELCSSLQAAVRTPIPLIVFSNNVPCLIHRLWRFVFGLPCIPLPSVCVVLKPRANQLPSCGAWQLLYQRKLISGMLSSVLFDECGDRGSNPGHHLAGPVSALKIKK